MKKFVYIIVLVLILFSHNNVTAFSEDNSADTLDENVQKYTDMIDFSDIEKYIAECIDDEGNIFSGGFRTVIDDIINGNFKNGFSELYVLILKLLTSNVMKVLPIIASIIATGVLCSLSSNLASGFIKKSTMEIIYFVCYATIIILTLTALTSVSAMATKTIKNLNRVIDILFPIMLTLITSLGGTSTVAIYQGSLAILSSLVTTLLTNIIIPAFMAVIVFSIVGNMSSNVKLDKLANTFKSGAEWLMGISFGLYMIVLAFQGIGGAAVDGISVKAMKFMMSSYVPILGGYLSDGFDVIMASCVLIKNAVGISGVMIIILTIIYPIINIIVLTFGLRIAASILEPIADKRISDFLYLVSKSTTLLISAILGIGLIMISSIMLLVATCNGGVI